MREDVYVVLAPSDGYSWDLQENFKGVKEASAGKTCMSVGGNQLPAMNGC